LVRLTTNSNISLISGAAVAESISLLVSVIGFDIGSVLLFDDVSERRFALNQETWAPSGFINRYLTSHSRLSRKNGLVGSVSDHVRTRRNPPNARGSPTTLFGVVPQTRNRESDSSRQLVHEWDPKRFAALVEFKPTRERNYGAR
jgi:hypothetical protein